MGLHNAWLRVMSSHFLLTLTLFPVLFSSIVLAAPEISHDAIEQQKQQNGHSIHKRYSSFRTDLGKRDGEFIGTDANDVINEVDILNGNDGSNSPDLMDKRFSSFRSDFGKRSDDELEDITEDLEKRFSAFRADLGKRGFRADLGKRFSAFRSDLGKRAYFRSDLGKRAYGFRADLGKRSGTDDDDEENVFDDAMELEDLPENRAAFRADIGKRASAFRADLGKRFNRLRSYWVRPNYLRDIGKRLQQFRADLGKRSAFRADLGKRAAFRADLGKRSTDDLNA